uniref:Baculovirus repeated ORF-c n=1 Tax=Anticarsia gemmatalis multiple nucleopolyhedrovirus TaxID=268591 RepID=A0A0S3IZU6_9ABAC|nr:baculovirus repeated ORF-c [Anticarsia gemmatalis multiple nucleopolyhedrovirus]ALR71532.1 baculovirus repeated ORF-c [Anticarsia gemmatalis multiple nucleopolyhedrovirus]
MAVDAPAEIAEGINAVHVAVTNGQQAPWMADLEFYKKTIVEKDEKIETLTIMLQTANVNLTEANKNLMTAFNIVNEARRDSENARKDSENARKDLAQLANRMADIAQDVIAKPANPQLCHSLAVCDIGNNEYAFLRPQKRSLQRSLRRLGSSDVIFSSDYVPNSMNVLNKVKESIPRNNFKAKHNKITLLENYTKDQLMDVINSTMTERQIARLNLRNN